MGRPVDEGRLLEDAGYGEDGGGGYFLVPLLDRFEQVVGGVVDAGDDVRVAFGVGCPLDDDLVEAILLLEIAVTRLMDEQRLKG